MSLRHQPMRLSGEAQAALGTDLAEWRREEEAEQVRRELERRVACAPADKTDAYDDRVADLRLGCTLREPCRSVTLHPRIVGHDIYRPGPDGAMTFVVRRLAGRVLRFRRKGEPFWTRVTHVWAMR